MIMTHASIVDTAQQAPSRAAYRREIVLGLQGMIGSDLAVFQEIAPKTVDMRSVFGVDEHFLGRARDEHSGPYAERLMIALQQGRTVVDAELFGVPRLRELRF